MVKIKFMYQDLFINEESKCKKNIELLNILDEVIKTEKFYILRGGLAIALYYKKIYRCHKDIDFYFDNKDFSFWLSFFRSKYYLKKSRIPFGCQDKMYEISNNKEHIGHIVFIDNINNKKNILKQIYNTKECADVQIISKYSKFMHMNMTDKIKEIENGEDPIMKIDYQDKQINILNIKYLEGQKIFASARKLQIEERNLDSDLKFYFNLSI